MQETFKVRYSDTKAVGAYENIVKPTIGDVAGAAFEQGLTTNITPSLLNLLPDVADGSKMLSPEEATQKYQVGNLKFDQPISESRAQELREKQLEQMRRQEIMRLGPQHLGADAVKFGAGLASTFADPVGLVASAFIPQLALGKLANSVGGAAKTYMTMRAGQTVGQRAAFGAIEGAAGAAMFEPIVYMSQQKDQLDYSIADSFVNIAFGGILGGGIHAIGRGLELRGNQKEKELSELIKSQNEREGKIIELLDRIDVQERAEVQKVALSEILQNQSPKNIDATLQRYAIDRAYRSGLSEVTFKVDGTLTDENLFKLQKRSGGNPVAAIPVAKFKTNAEVNSYIKSSGKNRTDFITQRDSFDNLVVSEIKNAQVVRDANGAILKFNGREAALKYIKDSKIDAQLISLQARQGASEQSHIVVRGITPEEAKAISQDASFVEFYEPIPKPAILYDSDNRRKFIQDNNIALKDYNFDPNDIENRIDIEPEENLVEFQKITYDTDIISDANLLAKYVDELQDELNSYEGYFTKEQLAALDADKAEFKMTVEEKEVFKNMGLCMRMNV